VLFGAEHSLGGIHAYHSTDTTDEDPQRVDLDRRTSTAFLRKALRIDDGAARSEVTADLQLPGNFRSIYLGPSTDRRNDRW